jgi:hypothetical protein
VEADALAVIDVEVELLLATERAFALGFVPLQRQGQTKIIEQICYLIFHSFFFECFWDGNILPRDK